MTHLFFAQAATQEVTFRDIGLVVCVLMLILLVVVQVMQLVDRNKKQSRVVSFEGTPVDKSEFDQFKAENKAEHETIHSRIGGMERGVEARLRHEIAQSNADAKESRKNLHEEMITVREDIASLKANAESMDKRTERIEGKLDEFIQRAR